MKQTRIKSLKQKIVNLEIEISSLKRVNSHLHTRITELERPEKPDIVLARARIDLIQALSKVAYAAAIAANGHSGWGR